MMDEKMGVAVEAAFRELQRQLPQALDLTDNRTEVLPFDGFDLRAVIVAAIEAYESAKATQQPAMLTIPEIETKGRREL